MGQNVKEHLRLAVRMMLKPLVRLLISQGVSHGDFSIGLRIYLWVPNSEDSRMAKFWLLERVKKRIDREGVEIPFPYRTLVYKKDLPPPPKEKNSY